MNADDAIRVLIAYCDNAEANSRANGRPSAMIDTQEIRRVITNIDESANT